MKVIRYPNIKNYNLRTYIEHCFAVKDSKSVEFSKVKIWINVRRQGSSHYILKICAIHLSVDLLFSKQQPVQFLFEYCVFPIGESECSHLIKQSSYFQASLKHNAASKLRDGSYVSVAIANGDVDG